MKKISITFFSSFILALVLFSIIISGIFTTLFRKHAVEMNIDNMTTNAENIARTIPDYWDGSDTPTRRSGHMMMHRSSNELQIYLDFISKSSLADIWIINQDFELVTPGKMSNYTYKELPPEADTLIQDALHGKTTNSDVLSDFLGESTITISTPIINQDGNIIGAVLSHSTLDGLEHITASSLEIFLLSATISLPIAAIVAWILSNKLTKPIKQMNQTTKKLADGNYQIKTNIQRNDEIGELASSIDILASRLGDAQQEQAQLEQLRQTFISNISHELRTPVTVMRGSLEALSSGVISDQEKVQEYHEQMLSESIHLQRLVNDLLELSKLQSQDFSILNEPLNIVDVISDAWRSMQYLADKKEIKLLFEQNEIKSYFFIGDYSRLRQMFITVIDNAIKFSNHGSDIEIILTNKNAQLQVSIVDTGTGMESEAITTLFERFHRSTDEQNKSGSGLGLAIAKQIADKHHIQIDVDSKKNLGTTFSFFIPFVPNN